MQIIHLGLEEIENGLCRVIYSCATAVKHVGAAAVMAN